MDSAVVLCFELGHLLLCVAGLHLIDAAECLKPVLGPAPRKLRHSHCRHQTSLLASLPFSFFLPCQAPIDEWILQFVDLLKEHCGIDPDKPLECQEVGQDKLSAAFTAMMAEDEKASELLDQAQEKFEVREQSVTSVTISRTCVNQLNRCVWGLDELK